jgi:hypothetical protein
MYQKFLKIEENPTNCNYISATFNHHFNEKVEELKSLFKKCNCEVETELPLKSIYIQHLDTYDSSDFCDKSFLGFDGNNFYMQIYFNPIIDKEIIDKEIIDEQTMVSFIIEEEKVTNILNFFEMEYQVMVG